MNVAIGTKPNVSWKNGVRYVGLAMGAAVALSVAAAFGATTFDNDSNHFDANAARRARIDAIMSQPAAPQPDVVFYLVSSEAERNLTQAALDDASSVRYGSGIAEPETRFEILVTDDALQEADAVRIIGESSATGAVPNTKVEVFDLRK